MKYKTKVTHRNIKRDVPKAARAEASETFNEYLTAVDEFVKDAVRAGYNRIVDITGGNTDEPFDKYKVLESVLASEVPTIPTKEVDLKDIRRNVLGHMKAATAKIATLESSMKEYSNFAVEAKKMGDMERAYKATRAVKLTKGSIAHQNSFLLDIKMLNTKVRAGLKDEKHRKYVAPEKKQELLDWMENCETLSAYSPLDSEISSTLEGQIESELDDFDLANSSFDEDLIDETLKDELAELERNYDQHQKDTAQNHALRDKYEDRLRKREEEDDKEE